MKHFIAISDLAKRHLIKLGADSEKISTIHPGIDTSAFKPQELAKSSHMDESVIFVGKLEKHKGIDIVIETFHKTIKTHPNRKMTIVGEGSYGHTVHGLAQNEDQLEYYPNIDNKRIPTLLNQHTTFIMPARDTYKLGLRVGAEQFCFSIVEAMACGLSIVTTDCGAIPEIAGPSAYICKQEQLDTFHDKVDLALRSHSLKISKQNASLAQENFNKRHQAELIHRQIERIT